MGKELGFTTFWEEDLGWTPKTTPQKEQQNDGEKLPIQFGLIGYVAQVNLRYTAQNIAVMTTSNAYGDSMGLAHFPQEMSIITIVLLLKYISPKISRGHSPCSPKSGNQIRPIGAAGNITYIIHRMLSFSPVFYFFFFLA